MLARVQAITPVLLGITFVQLALGALAPFISLLLAQRGVPTTSIGLITSAYYVGFLVGSQTCAAIVDRVGHIRAFTVFAAIGADCALLHAIVGDPLVWGVLRAATGYAMSGAFLVTESWLNDKVDATSRGRVFAAYLLVSWSASAVGPLALNLHAALVAALVFAAALLLLQGRVFPVFLAVAFFYAAMTAPLYGLGAGQTNDYVSPREFVSASGGLLFAWAAGASAGPIVASGVMALVGPGGLFLYLALVLGVIALFTIFRMLRRSGLPLGLQSGFVPAPHTPAAVAALDPRSGGGGKAAENAS